MEVKDHVIVWLDILGYKELIKKSEKEDKENNLLRDIHDIMSSLKKYIDYNNKMIDKNIKEKHYSCTGMMSSFKALLFSDNIVFFAPYNTEIEKANLYTNLAYGISSFLFQYPRGELFFRGAITEGKLYYDDRLHFIYGSGLVRAYELESTIAKYPRIIIDTNMKVSPILVGFKEDSDEVWFLDYLAYGHALFDINNPNPGMAKRDISTMVSMHGMAIQKAMEENKGNKKVMEKYIWLANYHNSYCREYGMEKYII